jgi:hypothetical protein
MTRVSRYVKGWIAQAETAKEQFEILVGHKGERGRANEQIVRGIIRGLLPKRFSIGTGFAVSSKDARSAQLDIVLYDELVNTPLSLMGDVSAFPIECIYGAVEVKSLLDKARLEEAAKSIGQLRKFKEHKRYYRPTKLVHDGKGNFFEVPTNPADEKDDLVIRLAPRNYIFAFNTKWKLSTLIAKLHKASDAYGAFFHGVVVLKKGWFVTQLATRLGQPKQFRAMEGNVMLDFAKKLSKDTITYPMYPANMMRYLGTPESGDQ